MQRLSWKLAALVVLIKGILKTLLLTGRAVKNKPADWQVHTSTDELVNDYKHYCTLSASLMYFPTCYAPLQICIYWAHYGNVSSLHRYVCPFCLFSSSNSEIADVEVNGFCYVLLKSPIASFVQSAILQRRYGHLMQWKFRWSLIYSFLVSYSHKKKLQENCKGDWIDENMKALCRIFWSWLLIHGNGCSSRQGKSSYHFSPSDKLQCLLILITHRFYKCSSEIRFQSISNQSSEQVEMRINGAMRILSFPSFHSPLS